ncbi:MAG: spermidine synthase [Myxococcota bacterium]|jgi:spermidine synthase
MQRNASFSLLLVCFFLSGLAGLIYQTAWTREFAFVFGTSNLAVATVLAAYMAGLAAGAAVAARYAHKITRPLLTYGVLELGVGLSALGVPFAIHGSQALYVGLLGGQPGLDGSSGLLTASFYMVCSFAILMVPTAMMGATLPLLVRHSVHSDEDISGRIGLLYSINTAGAVVGTMFAAFVLLPNIGLRQTILVAAFFNLLVFVAAWLLARSAGGEFVAPEATQSEEATRATSTNSAKDASDRRARWILPLIFGSGLISFTYEVLWVRLLEHLLGGSVYAFSTMLASFLLGITLGAAVASRVGTTRARAALGFGIAQLGIAVLSLAAFAAVDVIPDFTDNLTRLGWPKLLVDWATSTITLFPSATLIGATFPFAVRILARDEADAGQASAVVYAVNTLGSVVGSIGAGFFIIPLLGYAGTLIACVAVNLLLALATALTIVEQHARRLQVSAVIALLVLAVAPPDQPWKILRYSAIGSGANVTDKVEYLGVGRAATVLVLKSPAHWYLRTNGNPEGRISPLGVRHNQANVARWLGGLPSLARPNAETMLVVGFGGGVALETIPPTIKQVDVIELEPEVIAGNQAIGETRWRDPLKDPRITVHLDDARNALTLTDQRFDAIVSQPSHPWSAGASHLYTQEFFELAQEHLNPNGVFVQWIGLSFVDEALFRTLLATLIEVYGHVQVYAPAGNTGVLFLASDTPFDTVAAAKEIVAKVPNGELEHLGVYSPEDVLTSMLLDDDGVRELARGAELNRDDHNIMQIRSPNVLNRSVRNGIEELTRPYDPLLKLPREGLDSFYLAWMLPPRRAAQLAETIEDPIEAKVVEMTSLLNSGKSKSALQVARELLESDPRNLYARATLLQMSTHSLGRGRDPGSVISLPLTAKEEAFYMGWRYKASEDWQALESLDAALATIERNHPLSNHAYSLRAEWRIQSGNTELGREAVHLVDTAVWSNRHLEGALLRARACVASEDYLAAIDSLSYFNRPNRGGAVGKGYAKRVQSLMERIPPDPELNQLRNQIKATLEKLAQ